MTDNIRIEDNEAFDATLAEQLAKSSAAFEAYAKTVDRISAGMIGRYYGMPPKMQAEYDAGRIVCFRVGLRSSQAAKSLAHLMRQQGWFDAPRGTRHAGTEVFDGEEGPIILCAQLQDARRMHEVRDRAQAKRANAEIVALDGFARDVAAMGAVVEDFDVRVGQASTPDVAANVRDARSRSEARGRR